MRAILTYHSLDDSGSPISVPPATFDEHVAFLTGGTVRVVPLDALAATADESRPAVAVTFDDGFQNTAPALFRLMDAGVPTTVFVVTSHVGRTNAWRGQGDAGMPVLPLLTWEELGRLAARGVSLGAHTRTHPRLTTVSDEALREEIDGSRQDLVDRIGVSATSFAYPYGDVDARVRDAATGFAASVTTRFAPLRAGEDLRDLPRLDMYYFRRPGALTAFGSGAFSARVRRIALQRRLRGWLS